MGAASGCGTAGLGDGSRAWRAGTAAGRNAVGVGRRDADGGADRGVGAAARRGGSADDLDAVRLADGCRRRRHRYCTATRCAVATAMASCGQRGNRSRTHGFGRRGGHRGRRRILPAGVAVGRARLPPAVRELRAAARHAGRSAVGHAVSVHLSTHRGISVHRLARNASRRSIGRPGRCAARLARRAGGRHHRPRSGRSDRSRCRGRRCVADAASGVPAAADELRRRRRRRVLADGRGVPAGAVGCEASSVGRRCYRAVSGRQTHRAARCCAAVGGVGFSCPSRRCAAAGSRRQWSSQRSWAPKRMW